MSFRKWGYEFDGPYLKPDYLRDEAGVYLVCCENTDELFVLDVGQSGNVRERLKSHERSDCWFDNCFREQVRYSATYTHNLPEGERIRIEQLIRQLAKPLCSEHMLIG